MAVMALPSRTAVVTISRFAASSRLRPNNSSEAPVASTTDRSAKPA